MDQKEAIAKNVPWFVGAILTILGFIFAEGWLIAAAKMLGAFRATILVSAVTLLLAWFVIFLSTGALANSSFKTWLSRKEEKLSKRAKAVLRGGKLLTIINTTVFLGPIVASLLMLMLGFKTRKVYFYAVFCAILCAGIWCSFYAGLFWGFEKIFLKGNGHGM